MMVVQEDCEKPVEVALIRRPLVEPKSYVIVKNHVRELINISESSSTERKTEEISSQSLENDSKTKRKSNKKHKNTTQKSKSSDQQATTEIIDKSDLEELKTVYKKCKDVINKIETKYGHLLDLNSGAGPSSHRKRKINSEESTDSECDCKLNKKIVFDDDGKQVAVDRVPDNHICAKKVKGYSEKQTKTKTIAIEYTDNEISLPETLPELASMLQNQDVEKTLRNKIVNKMRMLKQDYANDIKFNKQAIIEKIKANPDEVLAFKGTNLSTLKGYL